MKSLRIIYSMVLVVALGVILPACQKLDRPVLGELILDPPKPPLTILGAQSYYHFDGSTRDTGSWKLPTVATGVSFVPGVTAGEGAKFGTTGSMVVRTIPNALKSPGSFSVAFWMNSPGPVQGGTQGLFAVSKSNEFWGNFEVFLENLNNGAEAFIKIHMYNSGVAAGNGEEWTEVKIPGAHNKWTHIAITYDAATSQITVFADGQPTSVNKKVLGGGTYGPLVWTNVTGMTIGTFAFQVTPTLASHGAESWARSFAGTLDQFRIYTKALTPAEVTNLFTNKL